MSALSLSTIGGGALERRFQQCWKAMTDNLSDTSTDPTAPRTVTATIGLKAKDDQRSRGSLALTCVAKLAPSRSADRPVIFRMEAVGMIDVYELEVPPQAGIPQPVQAPAEPILVEESKVGAILLSTFAAGAFEERFQLLWSEVCRNMADPNTPAEFERLITLEVKVTATDSPITRGTTVPGLAEISCKAKLAAPRIVTAPLYFSLLEPDRVVLSERDLRQRTIAEALTVN